MDVKHTPGPWCWMGDNTLWSEGGGEVIEADDDGQPWGMHSAEIRHHHNPGTKEANKALIAAAPDLLWALIDCVLVMERELNGLTVIRPELLQARAAIAKATGDSV